MARGRKWDFMGRPFGQTVIAGAWQVPGSARTGGLTALGESVVLLKWE